MENYVRCKIATEKPIDSDADITECEGTNIHQIRINKYP